MRLFLFVVILGVISWFAYGFLEGETKADKGGGGLFESPQEDTTPDLPKPEEPRPGPATPVKTPTGKEPKPPKATLDLAPLQRATPQAALTLVKGNAARGATDPGWRQAVVDAVERSLEAGKVETAGRLLTHLLDHWTARSTIQGTELATWRAVDKVQRRVMERLLFTKANPWRSLTYVIRGGDSLERICGRYVDRGTLVRPGFIAAVNRIKDPGKIRKGHKLRVPVGKLKVVVERRSHMLKLFFDEVMIRCYLVGLGKQESPTPKTVFKVVDRSYKPVWWSPSGKRIPYGHPLNPLGDHYIKLKDTLGDNRGYGIHGTRKSDRNTIGTDSSDGCVRMYAEDVAELYGFLPKTTVVEVR